MNINIIKWILISILTSQFIFAGGIRGKVTDAGSGDFLPGANVVLDGTNYGASSDRFGEFTISNVTDGS